METKLQSKQQYPRFIQNKPCGIDKFDGGSQERLAKTIARHFCQNDSLDEECTLPRIIGIEGIWGSGKSNVVKMLERELSDDYYFFEYDAWGHQEDLQRRSILELLTSKLIDDGILSGNATIKVKGGGTKTVSWSEKLKYLLARKTETVTEKYPLISNGMVAAFLVAVLTPITAVPLKWASRSLKQLKHSLLEEVFYMRRFESVILQPINGLLYEQKQICVRTIG